MKLFQRQAAKPLGFYIGLRDKTGKESVSCQVFSRIDPDTAHNCKGIYTNNSGDTYSEPSIYTEKAKLQDVIEALQISNQESALMVDTHGVYSFVKADGTIEGSFTGYWTTEKKSDNTTYINGMYLNLI